VSSLARRLRVRYRPSPARTNTVVVLFFRPDVTRVELHVERGGCADAEDGSDAGRRWRSVTRELADEIGPRSRSGATPSARAVLAINAGSSSVKCALFTFEAEPRPLTRETIDGVASSCLPRLLDGSTGTRHTHHSQPSVIVSSWWTTVSRSGAPDAASLRLFDS